VARLLLAAVLALGVFRSARQVPSPRPSYTNTEVEHALEEVRHWRATNGLPPNIPATEPADDID
jgi:hypothetical protein